MQMVKSWQSVCILGVVLLGVLLQIPAEAKKTLNDAGAALSDVVKPSGITEGNLSNAAGTVVKGILSAIGLLFFILMVYAGMVWMLARGDEARVTKARDTIIAATIGLVIVVASYAITNLVVDRIILKNTGDSSGILGEETPNTLGGEKLGCCIMPVDFWSKGTAIPSPNTGPNCQQEAIKIWTEEDYKDQQGKKWEFYSDAKAGETSVCINIASCWVTSLSEEERDECVNKLFQ